MIGRVPVQPTYVAPPSYAQGGYAMPSAPAPYSYRNAPAPAVPQGAAPSLAQAPRPGNGLIVRGQQPDEPIEPLPPPPARPSEPIHLPSPEELGVGTGRAAEPGIDWAAVNRRIENLGAVCFQMNRLPEGRWRVTCLVPTAQPDRTQRIEAEANVRGEAVRLALEQAEQWAQRK
jgi:hypothetical protein